MISIKQFIDCVIFEYATQNKECQINSYYFIFKQAQFWRLVVDSASQIFQGNYDLFKILQLFVT